jgi:hypothetical protein
LLHEVAIGISFLLLRGEDEKRGRRLYASPFADTVRPGADRTVKAVDTEIVLNTSSYSLPVSYTLIRNRA